MKWIAVRDAHAIVQRVLWSVIVCVLLSIVMFMVANEARASSGSVRADSDGYVPVRHSCWAGNTLGFYRWYFNGYQTRGVIVINKCGLNRLGAGPRDYRAVVAHERGHSRGLAHSRNPSSVMYPVIRITGR